MQLLFSKQQQQLHWVRNSRGSSISASLSKRIGIGNCSQRLSRTKLFTTAMAPFSNGKLNKRSCTSDFCIYIGEGAEISRRERKSRFCLPVFFLQFALGDPPIVKHRKVSSSTRTPKQTPSKWPLKWASRRMFCLRHTLYPPDFHLRAFSQVTNALRPCVDKPDWLLSISNGNAVPIGIDLSFTKWVRTHVPLCDY